MKVVIALALLCVLACSVNSENLHQWGAITKNLVCREHIVLEGKLLRHISKNVTCRTVSTSLKKFKKK